MKNGSSQPIAAESHGTAPDTGDGMSGISAPSGRLVLGGLVLVNFALFAAFSGVISVLIPRQVEALAPADKVAALALVLSTSFAVTAIAQPILGALSDRTTSRFGRRIPWMIVGAVVGGVALGVAAGAGSIAVLTVAWAVGQFALNGTDIASTAFLVDRVPARRRGMSFATVGVAAILGGAVGAVFAGRLTGSIGATYWLLAGLVAGVVLIFALLIREPPGGADPATRVRGVQFLRQFLVDPRRHTNFFKVLGWKLFSTLSYAAVHGYLLYLLTDYIEVARDAAPALVGLLTAVGGVGVIGALLVGGWLSDRVRRRTPFLVVAGVLVIVGNLVAILVPTIAGIVVLAASLGLSMGLSIACGTALGSELIPAPRQGIGGGMGILNLAGNLGQAFAPALAAIAITITGSYVSLFATSIVAVAVAIGLIVTVRDPR